MEIKINKEINGYQESIFFGLNTRQFICSMFALGMAVGVYFWLKEPLGQETVSWVCILCAAPFAALGFFQYQGMTAERVLIAIVKSEILCAGPRTFEAVNLYEWSAQEMLQEAKRIRRRRKEAAAHN